jgi:hypothetical protein
MLASVAAVGTGTLLAPAAADPGPSVHGDDALDRYVGTGGLVLPASTSTSDRQAAAGCADCHWRLTSPCVTSAAGNAFGGGCSSVVRGCPGGELLRPWLQQAGEDWRPLDLVCLSDGPVTVDAVGRAARERLVQGVPALSLHAFPPSGIVTQLPVAFATGQPEGPMQWSEQLMGMRVLITARPHGQWRFGDGATLQSDAPGGPHPSAVEHTYRASGPRSVSLEVRWSATYTVAGLGPFTVSEPVMQEAALPLTVGEGRALLAPVRG